jgi:hypothetical protein
MVLPAAFTAAMVRIVGVMASKPLAISATEWVHFKASAA